MYTFYAAFAIWAALNLLFFLLARHLDARAAKVEYRQTIVSNVPGIVIISFFVTFFVGGMVSDAIGNTLPTKTIVASTTELAALRSTNTISGSFFLGCGTIEGRDVYQIYVRNADGSASPDRVWVSRSTRIFESKSLHTQGYWKVIETVRDQSGPRAKWASVEDDGVLDSWNQFDVPEGTILHNFSLQ